MSMESETNEKRPELDETVEPETAEAEAAETVVSETAEAEEAAAAETEETVDAEAQPEKQAQNALGPEAEAEKKPRKLSGTALVAIIVALGVIGASIFALIRGKQGGDYALKVGDTKYSAAEVNFEYFNSFQQAYSQFGMYVTDLMPDDPYTLGAMTDGTEYETWGDLYMDQTKQHLQQLTALCDMAKKDNVTLEASDTEELDSAIQELKDSASAQGRDDFDAFLAENYGAGLTEATVRSILERELLAMKYLQYYQDNLTYSQEELDAAYEADPDSFDTFRFDVYFAQADLSDEDADAEAAAAQAVKDAEAVLAQVESGDGEALDRLKAAVEDEAEVNAVSVDGAMLATYGLPFEDWLRDPARAAGDATVSEVEGSGAYVVVFEGRERSDSRVVDVRHILIQAEDADGDGEISDAEMDAAKAELDKIQAEWEAGDQTEDAFAALAETYSDDLGSNTNGGLYEDVYEGQMVPAFNDYCFDPDRKPGDVGVVKNTVHNGWHLIYYVDQGDVYTDMLIREQLVGDDMDQFMEDLENDLPEVTEGKAIDQIDLPSYVLEQLQNMKDAATQDYSDYALPAESDVLPETEGGDEAVTDDAAEAEAQESAAP